MILVRVYSGDTPITNGVIDSAYRNDYFESMVWENNPYYPGKIVEDSAGNLYY